MSGTNQEGAAPNEASATLEQIHVRREEVAESIYAHIQAAVPEPVSDADPDYQEGWRAAILSLLDYSVDAIAAGGHSHKPIPDAAKAQARLAARAGMSLGVVIRRYLFAHGRLGACIVEEAAKIGASSDAPMMHDLRRVQEALLEHLTAAIEHEYNKESERVARSPAQRLAVTVRRLLNEEFVSPQELSELRYEIDNAWHIGLVAEGAESGRTVSAIGAALGCELLAIASGAGLIWAWFGTQSKIPARRVDAGLSRQTPTRLIIGESRKGLDGFRRTHAEALVALAVARDRPVAAIRCADVTLDAALLANPLLFTLHQETYLTPLDRLRNEGHTARATLHAYFACEQNKASTCAKLGVSRKTVENRLQQIASALKRPLHTCLPELQVALRLEGLTAAGAAHRAVGSQTDAGAYESKASHIQHCGPR